MKNGIPQQYVESAREFFCELMTLCQSKPLRSLRQFARDEIILPDDGGPYSGEPYDPLFQPYADLLFDEIDSGHWSEIYVTGPTQSGKTLSAFVIPLVYVVVELQKNVVVGVPIGEMINDKWQVDILPVLQASPFLSRAIPSKGPGSPGNRVIDHVTLANGVTIKFMTRGGSDASKAAFTASRVIVTEAPSWSQGVSTSKEADPLAQLRGRTRSRSRFNEDQEIDSDRQMLVEGTVTVSGDLPWKMKAHSSDSRLVCPCVHCKEYVQVEKENFGGFEESPTELDAAKDGCFFCPKCGEEINQEQRVEMVKKIKLIHKGQTIAKDGKISGDRPKTSVLFFRWSAFHNLFLKISDLAADAWKVAQYEPDTPERDEAEKEENQQIWCKPSVVKLVDTDPLDRGLVRKRQEKFTIGTIPPDTSHLVFGVDVGRWKCWYFAMAFRSNGTIHTPIFGSMDTGLSKQLNEKERQIHEGQAIRQCLGRIFDLIENGFPVPNGQMKKADFTLVDTRYATQDVFAAIKERGTSMNGPFIGIQGVGKSQLSSRKYSQPKKVMGNIRKICNGFYYEYSIEHRQIKIVLDSDSSKMSVQKCLRTSVGEPGSLTLPLASEQDLAKVSQHLASEVFKKWVDKDGVVREEYRQLGENHLLDCAGYAYVGGMAKGWRIQNSEVKAAKNKINKPPAWLLGVRK